MIEVEKKFQPTDVQLKVFLQDAQFVSEKTNHDIYYDYSDYRLHKKEIHLRSRNGKFELKIGDDEGEGTAEEIEDEEKIKEILNIQIPISDYINQNMIDIIDYKTRRQEYKKGEFTIDIDEMSYGYKCVEVELLVESNEEVELAHKKIIEFVKRYGWEVRDLPAKRKEYFRINKPKVYKELYKK